MEEYKKVIAKFKELSNELFIAYRRASRYETSIEMTLLSQAALNCSQMIDTINESFGNEEE